MRPSAALAVEMQLLTRLGAYLLRVADACSGDESEWTNLLLFSKHGKIKKQHKVMSNLSPKERIFTHIFRAIVALA